MEPTSSPHDSGHLLHFFKRNVPQLTPKKQHHLTFVHQNDKSDSIAGDTTPVVDDCGCCVEGMGCWRRGEAIVSERRVGEVAAKTSPPIDENELQFAIENNAFNSVDGRESRASQQGDIALM